MVYLPMATSEPARSEYFEDFYRLVGDRESSPDEKIARAIEVGRDRLGVEYGVVTYTGDGNYEVLKTNVSTGTYTPGSVTDLDTTWWDLANALFTAADFDSGKLGLGLVTVEQVVSGHGWTGTVESDDDGTRFEFTGVETRTWNT